MAGAKSGHTKDGKAKKRKRDLNESDARSKRPRAQNDQQVNGQSEGARSTTLNGEVFKITKPPGSTTIPDQNSTLQASIVRQFDDEAGWRVSKPMGGRLLDIDPILTGDEKFLILAYNTSIQVYTAADSLLIRRIPITTFDDNSASNDLKPAHIVATRLSRKNLDNVWVACSDGRIHCVNWTQNPQSHASFQTTSKTAKAMTLLQARISQVEEEVVLVLESEKPSRTELVAYLGLATPTPRSKSLVTIKKSGNALQLLESTEGGKVLVGAINDRLFFGALSQQNMETFDDVQYEFMSFDAPDLVSALDLRQRPRKGSAKNKRAEPGIVLDVLVGGARGGIYVYHDALANTQAVGKPGADRLSLQAQKYHWHRKAVRSVKWSRDGHYIISGGSENTLVLWQIDTGKQDFLPHLSGSVENIAVSNQGSSYVIHLDDNSVMIVTTAELKPTTYISGIQSATTDPLMLKDMLVQRVWTTQEHVRRPIPAAISATDSSKLHVCVGNGRQATMAGDFSAPLLQSFDIESFTSISRQALARTQPTDVNITNKGNTIDEPHVTHIAFSADGKWFASVDDWSPSMKSAENVAGEMKDQFLRERHETYLKFWEVCDGAEPLALVSRINTPHSNNYAEAVLGLASSPVSTSFATIGSDGIVRIWRPKIRQQDGIVAKGLKGQATFTWACSHVIPVGGGPDPDNAVDLASVTPPVKPQGSLTFSEDGSTLFAAFGSTDVGAVHVIDTATGEVIKTLEDLWTGQLQAVRSLSPFIVVLSDELRVFDVVGDELRYGIVMPQIPGVSELLHLAVDQKSGHFAVALPVGDLSSIGVFDPAEPEPLLVRSTPNRIVSLVSAPSASGFVALDDAAQIWVISEGSDPLAVTAAKPLQDLHLDGPVETGEVEVRLDEGDAEMASDEEPEDAPEDEEDVDMDDAQPSVLPQHLLADIFDAAPAFAAPSVEDMFYKVTSLLSTKPLAASES